MMNWNDYFICDFDTGLLYWKKNVGGRSSKGNSAGFVMDQTRNHSGFRHCVKIKNKRYYTARVIYEMKNGKIPDGMVIDHINGNSLDNRIQNLRVVNLRQNARNRKVNSTNTSGITGVRFHKYTNKWCAEINANDGKAVWLGVFRNKNEAVIARRAAEKVLGYNVRD